MKTSTKKRLKKQNRLPTCIICVLLAGVVWIAFGQTLGHDFVNFDDNDYVYENPRIIHGLSVSGIEWAFTHVHAANWHPLTSISHMLDVQLYGLQPWGHHLTNVLLQATAAILLFLALRSLTLPIWPSAFVAALFAIHPLRVESVAWISERKDLLSGVFFMLTHLGLCAVCAERSKSFFLVRNGSGAFRAWVNVQANVGDSAICLTAAGLLAAPEMARNRKQGAWSIREMSRE